MRSKTLSYFGLFFVVLVWGCAPLITLRLYDYFSPTARTCFSELILLATYLPLAGKHLKEFGWDYIKIGFPTGFFLAMANISQKIGLLYTTPSRYAFLENLSCITIPILMYLFVRKKPTFSTILGCFLCLGSVFILNGATFRGEAWGIGELLCGIAGLLYGFNIAGTAAFAKKLNVPLYLATQAAIGLLVSGGFTAVLDLAGTEPIRFPFSFWPIAIAALVTVVSSALCWIIRTNCLKVIDAGIVAVIMPFSAVVTGFVSVLAGKDTLDFYLIGGGLLGLFAILLPSLDDLRKNSFHL